MKVTLELDTEEGDLEVLTMLIDETCKVTGYSQKGKAAMIFGEKVTQQIQPQLPKQDDAAPEPEKPAPKKRAPRKRKAVNNG